MQVKERKHGDMNGFARLGELKVVPLAKIKGAEWETRKFCGVHIRNALSCRWRAVGRF